MNIFLVITIPVYIIQLVAILADVVASHMEDDGGFITTKKHLIIALIPYFWVVLLIRSLNKWFNNLK